jgi:hypothetical protein
MSIRLVELLGKIVDYQGVKTRIFDIGTEDLVRTLPGESGKYP